MSERGHRHKITSYKEREKYFQHDYFVEKSYISKIHPKTMFCFSLKLKVIQVQGAHTYDVQD